MRRVTNGQLLTNKDQVLSRWKEYFEQHLNECSEEEPHANQEPPTENDVIIDLPSHDIIVEAIEYLKGNIAASLDSIVGAELLKSGGPSLLNPLNLARHYLKAEPRVYCVQCTRRAINLVARFIAAFTY
jgi:hypothetical protein